MNLEIFRAHCLNLPAVEETLPFDNSTLAYKIAGKIFALTNIDTFLSVNLKCDPEHAVELRELYPAVKPGYHMNKKHWNTIEIDGSIPDHLILQWATDSYKLVREKLPAKLKAQLPELKDSIH